MVSGDSGGDARRCIQDEEGPLALTEGERAAPDAGVCNSGHDEQVEDVDLVERAIRLEHVQEIRLPGRREGGGVGTCMSDK